MSGVQSLKVGESMTVKSAFTAYTGVKCQKHDKQMIAILNIPPRAIVKKYSDFVYTSTNAYVKSVGHPGAPCSIGKSLQDSQKFVKRASVRFIEGLKFVLGYEVAQKSKWSPLHVDVWRPPAKAEPEPEKAEPKPAKAEPAKAEPAKAEPEPEKAEPKPAKAEPKPAKAEPELAKRKNARPRSRKKSPPKKVEPVDESVMDKFFSDVPKSSRKNNISE